MELICLKKLFIIDTNVLIHDPNCLHKFKNTEIVIPMVALEELDNLKTRVNEVGRSARRIIKKLDSFKEFGSLVEGVELETGSSVRIETDFHDSKNIPKSINCEKNDNKILAVAFGLQKKYPKKDVIIVSKDINLRVKADALRIQSEDYETDKVDLDVLFNGFEIIHVTKNVIEEFYREGRISLEKYDFFPNQCILLKVEKTSLSALCKYYEPYDELIPLFHIGAKPWGITARNLEQRFAMELLLSDEIKLVSLVGAAGTGKTLLALACGLQKVVEEKQYQKLLVARPIIPMGKDIGYLPGSKNDKLSNWMQPITDNLDFLFAHTGKEQYRYLQEQGLLEVEALTYIRGRSLPKCFFIIDEAQNLSIHEIKTIITRAGEGSKIIFTGDPYQIDNTYLDESSNGLSVVSERFKQTTLAGHMKLNKGERSKLATLGAELL